jgi:hypothetical protein
MIIVNVGLENASWMPLVEHHHIVETVTANTANEPFDVRVFPRTTLCNFDFFDAHLTDTPLEMSTGDCVVIPQKIPWRFVPWKGFHELLCRPFRRRVLSDIEVHDAASIVSQNDEYEEHSQFHGRHGEKVSRNQALDMIVQEGLPHGWGWLTRPGLILLHSRFGHVNAKLAEFPDDSGRVPGGVRLPHVSDQITNFFRDVRSTRFAQLTQAPPVVSESLLLPGDDRTGLDELKSLLPSGLQAREPDPEQVIRWPKLRAGDVLLIDGDLMSQGNESHLHGDTRP